MAYNAPELLLVGAAQNLVLATSGLENSPEPCQLHEKEPDGDKLYDGSGLW